MRRSGGGGTRRATVMALGVSGSARLGPGGDEGQAPRLQGTATRLVVASARGGTQRRRLFVASLGGRSSGMSGTVAGSDEGEHGCTGGVLIGGRARGWPVGLKGERGALPAWIGHGGGHWRRRAVRQACRARLACADETGLSGRCRRGWALLHLVPGFLLAMTVVVKGVRGVCVEQSNVRARLATGRGRAPAGG